MVVYLKPRAKDLKKPLETAPGRTSRGAERGDKKSA